MKLKLLLQILILSSFSYMMQANTSVAHATAASVVQSVGTLITLTGVTDNPNLTFSIVTQPLNGTLTGLTQVHPTSAHVTYTSTNSFAGLDTFTFQVTNNLGLVSAPVTVSIQVLLSSARAYIADLTNTVPYPSQVGIINVGSGTAVGAVTGVPNYANANAMVATPDGNTVYVCYGSVNQISILDAATNVTLPNVSDLFGNLNFPIAMAISPDSSKAYICNANSNGNNAVSILNLVTNIVTGDVSDPSSYMSYPTAIAFTPDGSRAYVANGIVVNMITSESDTVTTQVAGIALSGNLVDLVISPDGNFAYVVSQNGGAGRNGVVYIIDTNPISGTYNTCIGTINDVVRPLNNPVAMAIAPNGLKAYIVNNGGLTNGSYVSVVDLNPADIGGNYQKITASVSGIGFTMPVSVAFTADGSQAYVINQLFVGLVNVITVSSDTATSTITGNSLATCLVFLGDNPTANQTAATVAQNSPTAITLTGTDPESETLTFSIASGPLHGTVTFVNNPTTTSAVYTYRSSGTYVGPDTFTFTVTNSAALVSSPTNVFINILPQSAKAYIPNYPSSHSQVGIINVATGASVGNVTDLPNYAGHTGSAITPDGTKAYVVYGTFVNSKIAVIDAATNAYLYDIANTIASVAPNALAISPDGTLGYVSNYYGNDNGNVSISIFSPKSVPIDTITGSVTDPYEYIQNPNSIVFTPDGTRAYVASSGNALVCMIDTNSNSDTYNQVVAVIANGLTHILSDLAISPDGNFLYVASYDYGFTNGYIYIIDINPKSPTYNQYVGSIDPGVFPFNFLTIVTIAPNGLKAYGISLRDSAISIIDLNPASGSYRTVTGNITVGIHSAEAVEFTANGLQAYAVNQGDDTVSIIDVASDTVIGTIGGYTQVSPGLIAFLGIGTPFFSLTNNKVMPVASALDATTGIMYEVGNAQDGSGDLILMASNLSAGDFGLVSTFTKSGQVNNGVISYSTSSLLNIGGTSFTQLDMALQNVGGISKIIVSGSNNLLNKGFVARFNTIPVANSLDGVLDDTFGDYQSGTSGPQKGYTIFTGVAPAAGFSSFSACGIDASQNIVVAGSVGVGGGASTGQLVTARYTQNGFLDTTFGPQPQVGYGYSTVLGLSGPGYFLTINDIEFDPLKNIFIVGQYQAPLIPAPGLSSQGTAGTSPFILKFVHSGIPDQSFYSQFGTFMIPIQYVKGQGEFNKCVYDIAPISNLSSSTMYAAGNVQNLKTSPIKDYATLVRFTIANLSLSASQSFISGNGGALLPNLQGNICPSLVVPAYTAVAQISGAQGSAVATFNSIKTSQDIQNILSLSSITYNLINSLEGAGATTTLAQSIGNNFQATMVAVINNFVANYPGNLLQNFLFLSQSIAVNECLLTTNISKFIYLQLIYAAEKAIQINVKTAASYCTSTLISPYT